MAEEKKKERLSEDLLEALKLVCDDNAGLKLRVLKKIKTHLAMKDQTIFDVAQDKKNAKKKKKKDKKPE